MKSHLIFACLSGAAAIVLAPQLGQLSGSSAVAHRARVDLEARIPVDAANTPGDDGACIFRITTPGNYYLTGNVIGARGKSGVEIACSGVTLDLMGFDVVGVPGSTCGIRASAEAAADITIRNGGVRSWGELGIDAAGARITHIENVTAQGNAGGGVSVADGAQIIQCVSRDNGGTGFSCAPPGRADFSHCTATGNASYGFDVGSACTMLECTAGANAANGFHARLIAAADAR